MTAVSEALAAYRAAVDACREAEYVKQQAAQTLYEVRQAEGNQDATPGSPDSGEPLPDTAFHACIAVIDQPTTDGRVIATGAINWAFGQRVPVTSGFEGGAIIGWAIPTHVDDYRVMASVYIEARALRLITPLGTSISLGIGLDFIEANVADDGESILITKGRLRHIAAQPAESASWPDVVVKP